MESVFITTRKQRIIREMRDYMMIALGMLMYSIGWTVFLLPNDITTGGVPGIASIVYWATGFPVQYTYFSINFFLLLLALKLLGIKFCIKQKGCIYCMTSLLWRVLSVLLFVAVVLEWHFRLTEAPEERILLPLLLINIVILP